MRYVTKDCPKCGEKMTLLMANVHFRPGLLFNFHCDKCQKEGNNVMVKYNMKQFDAEAKSFKNQELAKLLADILK